MGSRGTIKIPVEQFEEVTAGRGDVVDWLLGEDVKRDVLLAEEADPQTVQRVVANAYGDLDEVELQRVGRDPFLIGYAVTDLGQRTVVTFEVSAPGQRRGKRKIPDACAAMGVPSCNLFTMIRDLDFTTNWRA
jgi:hypothetical protein